MEYILCTVHTEDLNIKEEKDIQKYIIKNILLYIITYILFCLSVFFLVSGLCSILLVLPLVPGLFLVLPLVPGLLLVLPLVNGLLLLLLFHTSGLWSLSLVRHTEVPLMLS